LLAKTQLASRMSAEELLERLKNSKFNLAGITTDVSYLNQERRMSEHLSKVFYIADITDKKQRQILRSFSLMPSLLVSGDNAKEWFNLKELNYLNTLEKKAWLQGSIYGYMMHPVIASAIRYSDKPTCENSAELLEYFTFAFTYERNEHATEAEQLLKRQSMLPHAKSIANILEGYSFDDKNKYYSDFVKSISLVCSILGDHDAALRYMKTAMKTIGKEDYYEKGAYYNNMGVAHLNKGEYKQALEFLNDAMKILENLLGKEHPDTAATYGNIGQIHSHLGYYDQALEWHLKALDICEKVLSKEHPDTATTYNNIAKVYDNQGDYDKAHKWFKKALDVDEKVLGKEHHYTATTYNNIAGVYITQGDYDKALEWYQKALDIREKVLGKEHPDTATTYNDIGFVYDNQGDNDKALEWYQKALDIREKVYGHNHPYTERVKDTIKICNAKKN